MMFLRLILTLSLALMALPLILSEPYWVDLAFLGVCTGLASAILLLRARRGAAPDPSAKAGRMPPRRMRDGKKTPARRVVVDGSNVMYWRENAPSLEPLLQVIEHLSAQGFSPGVVFDANAGYKLSDRYLDDRHLARLLALPVDRVLVVAKGQPADPVILQAAQDLDAPVVSNDRYRDWTGLYPDATRPDRLIRGGYRDGALWLEAALPEAPARAA